jgi:hypothetical protein
MFSSLLFVFSVPLWFINCLFNTRKIGAEKREKMGIFNHSKIPIAYYPLPFPPKKACQYSRRILAILVTEIPLGQTASHSQ